MMRLFYWFTRRFFIFLMSGAFLLSGCSLFGGGDKEAKEGTELNSNSGEEKAPANSSSEESGKKKKAKGKKKKGKKGSTKKKTE